MRQPRRRVASHAVVGGTPAPAWALHAWRWRSRGARAASRRKRLTRQHGSSHRP